MPIPAFVKFISLTAHNRIEIPKADAFAMDKRGVGGTLRLAILFYLVMHIISGSPKEQMLGINTSAVVARMTNENTVRYGAEIGDPDQPMNFYSEFLSSAWTIPGTRNGNITKVIFLGMNDFETTRSRGSVLDRCNHHSRIKNRAYYVKWTEAKSNGLQGITG